MDNQILKTLVANQSNQMHIDVLDLHSSEMSSWFLSEYKIRADDRKMKIYGKDKGMINYLLYKIFHIIGSNLFKMRICSLILSRTTYLT